MTDFTIPDHPAITTRRRHTDMRQRETFEPVYVPGDTRRYRPLTNVLVNLAGLAFFIIVAGLSAGWLAEVR